MRNRTRILLLTLATLALTGGTVGVVAYWYTRPTVVTIAVGPEDSPENRFAHRLADALVQSRSSIRLVLDVTDSPAQAAARFLHHESDLAILRTDERRIPPSVRALAVLEHEAILVIGRRDANLATLAGIEGHKVAVIGRDGRNEAFVRRLLEPYKIDFRRTELHTVPPEVPLDQVLKRSFDLVVLFEPLSRLQSAGEFASLAATGPQAVSVHAIGDARALERKVPGLFAETIEAGLLSGAPRLPDEDTETVSLYKMLVARAKLPESDVVELMRALFETGSQLGIEKTFATRIEPPETETGALIPSHEGASDYLDRDVQTLFERYSDLIYLSMSFGSLFGSAAIALYGTVLRRRPPQASDRLPQLTALRARARAAITQAECDQIEAEFDDLIDEVLRGLAGGSLSSRGLEPFRLACEQLRTALAAARARLRPLPPQRG